MKKTIIFISLLFLFIIIRLIYLNFYKKDYYNNLLSNKTNLFVYGVSAQRGKIYDKNGKLLVDNKGNKTIYYNKNNNINTQEEIEIAYKLASLIDIEEANVLNQQKFWLILNNDDLLTEEEKELYKERKITSDEVTKIKRERAKIEEFENIDKKASQIYYLMNKDYKYTKKEIKSNATEEEYAKVIESNIAGITGEITWERYYVYNDTLRSILGSVGNIYEEEKDYYLKKGYSLNDYVGTSYLEKQYEDILKGEKAIYKVSNDGTLKLIKEEVKGGDIYLSIDIDVQLKLEETQKNELLLAKKKLNTEYFKDVYTLISEPTTGKIIALSGIKINEDLSFVDVTNNVISSSYTVGSVVKGATINIGYNYNLIDYDKKIKDGCIKLYLNPEKCSWKNLGYLDDITALEMSSNFYQFNLAIGLLGLKYTPNMKLNVTEKEFNIYRETLASYGLGTLTEIDLPGEKEGVKGKTIADDLYLNLTIGQYDTYTPVELMQYINTFATKKRLKLSLIDKTIYSDKEVVSYEPVVLNDINISDEAFERIKTGLNKVMLSGTGKNSINSKYNSIGKTGTSQTFTDTDNDGIMDTKTISLSLVALMPKDNPKYSIAIIAPNASHNNGSTKSTFYVTYHISKAMTNFLFENE